MKRSLLAGFGFALALAVLSGCVPPQPAQIALVPEPVAVMPPASPPPVVLVPPPAAPMWVPTARHHTAAVAHTVIHRHWVRRYSVRTSYTSVWAPGCGSTTHPCDVEHIAVPIQ